MRYVPWMPLKAHRRAIRGAVMQWCSRAWLALALFVPAAAGAALQIGPLTMPGVAAGMRQAAPVERVPPVEVSLYPLKQAEALPAEEPSGVAQLGVARSVPDTANVDRTLSLLRWERLSDGRWSVALRFAVPGAHGIRAGVYVEAMPPGTLIRMYTVRAQMPVHEVDGAMVLAGLAMNAAGTAGSADSMEARTWWSPDLGGDAVELQWVLPQGAPQQALRLAVPRLSQMIRDPKDAAADAGMPWGLAKSLPAGCLPDVMCQEQLPRVRNAVVRMAFVVGGNTYGCTGVLVNNAQQDLTPYVLTAGHCIHDQAVASTLQMSWFYYAQSCDSTMPNPDSAFTYNGADWLATSVGNDMTLLRLRDAPPAGAVFAGWGSAAVPVGAALLGLHYPRGAMLKLNTMALQEAAQCSVDYTPPGNLACQPGAADGGFYRAQLQEGSIEPGSSGSPLFRDGQVAGTLTGGDFFCADGGAHVIYGRLDRALQTTFASWLASGDMGLVNSDAALSMMVPTRMPVYRFYIPASGANFFTIEASERDFVLGTLQGALEYQGIAFYASTVPASGMVPVYRFFNAGKVAHFFTANAGEKEWLQGWGQGWAYERIAWYVPALALSETTAMFRFYDYGKGVHYYTADAAERDRLQARGADFQYNGVAYYVWPAPASTP